MWFVHHVQDVLWWTLYQAEGLLKGSWLRRKALAECMRHIHYEVRACGLLRARAAATLLVMTCHRVYRLSHMPMTISSPTCMGGSCMRTGAPSLQVVSTAELLSMTAVPLLAAMWYCGCWRVSYVNQLL